MLLKLAPVWRYRNSIITIFNTLGKYIPEGFEKKNEKLANRYDTQSAQSNAGAAIDPPA